MTDLLRNCQAAFALLVLLPMLGAGGYARAGFAEAVGDEERIDWSSVQRDLIQDKQPANPPAPVPVGAGQSLPEKAPATPIPLPTRRHDAAPASTGDAGSPGASLASGGCVAANLGGVVEIAGSTRSELLFLAGCSEQPQAFSARLFRPPRA